MKQLNVKVEHIYHSGFTVETKNNFLVFDYYKGDITFKDKETYVFSTHGHYDHFNPKILDWDNNHRMNYIFSSDIDFIDSDNVHYMRAYRELNMGDIQVKTFSSTDLGVSFLVEVEGISIFFAGDLNWWYWESDSPEEKSTMENAFKKKIGRIIGNYVDLAFFPVDPRLEESYHIGGEYLIEKIKPKYFFPMHFGDKYDTASRFIHKMGDVPTTIVDINRENQIFEL